MARLIVLQDMDVARHRDKLEHGTILQPASRLACFTRGVDFCGDFAFIGLSQVRQSAIFSGIAICGVWVVNIQTGQTVALVKFEEAVQEIFAVQVVPGVRPPDVINDRPRVIGDSFVVPGEALGLVPGPLRYAAPARRPEKT